MVPQNIFTPGYFITTFCVYRQNKSKMEKKKVEPLQQHKQFLAQKSWFLACATTATTVQTQEEAMHMAGFIMEQRGQAELGVAQDLDKSLTGLEL